MKFSFPYTDRQLQMIRHPARVLWAGTGTKTGKSMAAYCWLIEGLLSGQACCFCGPWFYRSKNAFDQMKNLLQPFIANRTVRVNEARLQLTAAGGGFCDFVSADNANCLFGSNFDRLVLDESSRMPEAIYGAALTTISGTRGKLRLFFNLELGNKNWSIRHLLRVQRLSAQERQKCGEDFLIFPSGGDGLVSEELIQQLKSAMPPQLWNALYNAVISDSDCSLFRNLDKIFVGQERETPAEGVRYFLGVDLARKQDFTSATVIDEDGNVVAMERFSLLDWSLQVGKVALLYRTFGCVRCVADSTGVGDAVCEQLEDLGLEVERFVFTQPSRKALLEQLILACDNAEFTVPTGNKFHIYRQELESFEYVLDGVTAKYQAPGHDDTVFSLALAVHAFRANRGAVLGLIDYFKQVASGARRLVRGVQELFGEKSATPVAAASVAGAAVAESKPPVVTVDNVKEYMETHRTPPCPHPTCKNPCTFLQRDHMGEWHVHCKQCGRRDGEDLPATDKPGHVHRWHSIPGGEEQCYDCLEQRPIGGGPRATTIGAPKEYFESRREKFKRIGSFALRGDIDFKDRFRR
jgi:hypothetical protein